jgi:hypothetical protein
MKQEWFALLIAAGVILLVAISVSALSQVDIEVGVMPQECWDQGGVWSKGSCFTEKK